MPASPWILTADQLPPDHQPVLMALCVANPLLRVGFYDRDLGWVIDSQRHVTCTPHHWMPIPALPSEAA